MNKILLSIGLLLISTISISQNEPVINVNPSFDGQSYCDGAYINGNLVLEDPQADPISFDSLDVTAPLTPTDITVNNPFINGSEYDFSIDINPPYATGTSNITLFFSDDNFYIKVVNLTVTYNVFNATYTGPTSFCENNAPIDLSSNTNTSGGQLPNSFNINGTGVSGNSFDPNLAGQGVHTMNIEVTSSDGCVFTVNPSLTVNPNPTFVFNSSTNPSTCGGTDGEIDLQVVSGMPPYVLTYNPAGNINGYNSPIPNLTAGNYDNFEVTDANGCVDNYANSITLTDPTPTAYNVGPDRTVCEGDEVTLYVPSSPLYANVSWDNGIQDSVGFIATNTTTYTATITDPSNCVTNETVTVTVDPLPSYTFNDPSLSFCENYGVINLNDKVNVTPGIFDGGGVHNNTFDPIYLNGSVSSEVYHTYTDANGCTTLDTMFVTINDVPDLNFSITDASCGAYDGAIDATISGGQSPYSTYWSNGSTSEDISGLQSTVYYMNVEDANGCMAIGAATVSSSTISITATTTDVSCFDGNDGAIDLTVSGGAAPYHIEWLNDGAEVEDRTNISAGTWDVYVIDANGCQASHSVTINQPGPINTSMTATASTCSAANGGISAATTGGTSPYTFTWFTDFDLLGSTVGTGNTLTNVSAGAYSLQITDANGCNQIENTVLSDVIQADVTVESITNESCTNQGAIDISIQSNTAIASTIWNTGATTEDVTGLTAGAYAIEITSTSGCVTVEKFEIGLERPNIQEICIVGVDTNTQTNRVVWEKPVTTDISHYNIYRETSAAGEYIFVDSVLYADESYFVDSVAYPHMRSWRYKITAIDNCGIESLKSDHHKTIHAVKNTSVSGESNIHWDHYEGISYSSYDLYRYTVDFGWELIATLPATNTSYTDVPPSTNGLDYMLSIQPPAPCVSTKATSHNASRSNRSQGGLAGPDSPNGPENNPSVGIENLNALQAVVKPNPTNGIVFIQWTENIQANYQLSNLSGQVLSSWKSQDQTIQVDLENYSNGIYFITVQNDEFSKQFKVVKQ